MYKVKQHTETLKRTKKQYNTNKAFSMEDIDTITLTEYYQYG